MVHKYTDEEIKRIGGSNITLAGAESVNRFNFKHIPELIRNAERELAAITKSRKATAIAEAQERLDQLKEKQRAYRLAFPIT